MKVFMLGWEYPPSISGGLGTACHGLTTALARAGVEIDFVVPRVHGDEDAAHMRLEAADDRRTPRDPDAARSLRAAGHQAQVDPGTPAAPRGVRHLRVAARLRPYQTAAAPGAPGTGDGGTAGAAAKRSAEPATPATESPAMALYGGDLFDDVGRYADRVAALASGHDFDLVHAHDWLTWPAGTAVARQHGKPLVVHVHSLEHDRAGDRPDPRIVAIEHDGLLAADGIIAVSRYARARVHRLHGVPLDRIDVVHNGVTMPADPRPAAAVPPARPTVLFLGRVTHQKGPQYFVRAAARVVRHVPDAAFVVAGTGDLLDDLAREAETLGLGTSVTFAGFLHGAAVARAYRGADVFVMPSVSDPFGIAALEAMSFGTPVVVSRQSGVAELVQHVLKVDGWDVDRIARAIVWLVRNPALRTRMAAAARDEARRLHWDAAAASTRDVYHAVTRRPLPSRAPSVAY